MASKGQITGMRGVFLVAAELARHGFIVSPTSRSARGVDLLATNATGARTFAVEVKTTTAQSFWIVPLSAGTLKSKSFVWVFVLLRKNDRGFRFFVVPSSVLRKYVTKGNTVPAFVRYKDIKMYEDKWRAFGHPE